MKDSCPYVETRIVHSSRTITPTNLLAFPLYLDEVSCHRATQEHALTRLCGHNLMQHARSENTTHTIVHVL